MSQSQKKPIGLLKFGKKTYQIFDGVNQVGRNPSAAVNIKSLSVSQHHSVIVVVDKNQHFISDINSSNGTFLKGQKLEPLKLYKIEDGDDIKFANFESIYIKLQSDSSELILNNTQSQTYTPSFYGNDTQNISHASLNVFSKPITPDDIPTQIVVPAVSIHEASTQLITEATETLTSYHSVPEIYENKKLIVNIKENNENLKIENALEIENKVKNKIETLDSFIKNISVNTENLLKIHQDETQVLHIENSKVEDVLEIESQVKNKMETIDDLVKDNSVNKENFLKIHQDEKQIAHIENQNVLEIESKVKNKIPMVENMAEDNSDNSKKQNIVAESILEEGDIEEFGSPFKTDKEKPRVEENEEIIKKVKINLSNHFSEKIADRTDHHLNSDNIDQGTNSNEIKEDSDSNDSFDLMTMKKCKYDSPRCTSSSDNLQSNINLNATKDSDSDSDYDIVVSKRKRSMLCFDSQETPADQQSNRSDTPDNLDELSMSGIKSLEPFEEVRNISAIDSNVDIDGEDIVEDSFKNNSLANTFADDSCTSNLHKSLNNNKSFNASDIIPMTPLENGKNTVFNFKSDTETSHCSEESFKLGLTPLVITSQISHCSDESFRLGLTQMTNECMLKSQEYSDLISSEEIKPDNKRFNFKKSNSNSVPLKADVSYLNNEINSTQDDFYNQATQNFAVEPKLKTKTVSDDFYIAPTQQMTEIKEPQSQVDKDGFLQPAPVPLKTKSTTQQFEENVSLKKKELLNENKEDDDLFEMFATQPVTTKVSPNKLEREMESIFFTQKVAPIETVDNIQDVLQKVSPEEKITLEGDLEAILASQKSPIGKKNEPSAESQMELMFATQTLKSVEDPSRPTNPLLSILADESEFPFLNHNTEKDLTTKNLNVTNSIIAIEDISITAKSRQKKTLKEATPNKPQTTKKCSRSTRSKTTSDAKIKKKKQKDTKSSEVQHEKHINEKLSTINEDLSEQRVMRCHKIAENGNNDIIVQRITRRRASKMSECDSKELAPVRMTRSTKSSEKEVIAKSNECTIINNEGENITKKHLKRSKVSFKSLQDDNETSPKKRKSLQEDDDFIRDDKSAKKTDNSSSKKSKSETSKTKCTKKVAHSEDKNKKKSTSNTKSSVKRKLTADADKTLKHLKMDESLLSTPERMKRKLKPKVVFTMLNDPSLESLTRRLGGSVVDSVENCTVLITKSVQRSQKLLSAIGQSKPICSPAWLEQCRNANEFLDPWNHIIVDKEAEKKWNFKLTESLKRSSTCKLFKDFTFYLITNTNLDVLKGAIESCGGKIVSKMPKLIEESNFVVVCSSENRNKCKGILQNNPNLTIIEPEAVFDGTLRQEIRFEKHIIK